MARLLALAASALAALTPQSSEAFFGRVVASVPPAATHAELYVGDRRVSRRRVSGRTIEFAVPAKPGRRDLRIRFEDGERLVRREEALSTWLLPRSGAVARRPGGTDRALASGLARAGGGFDGYAGLWVHDLATGRTAGWNSDTSFPAASTVKLGVLVTALGSFGAYPERSTAWREIRDLAIWSSNLASNRLIRRLGGTEAGGSELVEQTLWRLGATASTFTGDYRLGTGVSSDTPRPLPIRTYRRTTARDLGTILFQLHAASTGDPRALRATRLTVHQARLGLALLLSSDPRGENAGLFRPWRRLPLAQKNGWTATVQHTAAIVYGRRGPVIVVCLTYAPDDTLERAQRLGARVAALVAP